MSTTKQIHFNELPENIADSLSHSVTLIRTATSYFNSHAIVLNLNQKATIRGLALFIDDRIFTIYTNDKPLSIDFFNSLISGLKEFLDCFDSSSGKNIMINYNYIYAAYHRLLDIRQFFYKVYC